MPEQYEATSLRNGRYAVRPAGQLGTCGWHPWPWTVVYVQAPSEQSAIWRAMPQLEAERQRNTT